MTMPGANTDTPPWVVSFLTRDQPGIVVQPALIASPEGAEREVRHVRWLAPSKPIQMRL
jgi:hypothetical protein